LKQHGHLISHLTVQLDLSEDELTLKDFSEAAAQCRCIDLTIYHDSDEVFDLANLHPVAGSLRYFSCGPNFLECGGLTGISALNSMSQLTALELVHEHLGNEEPWALLASLTSLRRLYLELTASGDPSPLSTLTELSCMILESCLSTPNDQPPFSFSSLQPLSTLQQLEVLLLEGHACATTSLQGLAGLSKLKQLTLKTTAGEGNLESLEGTSPAVVEFTLEFASNLRSLVGIEGCTSMEKLALYNCGVSSLQPLRGLSNLQQLEVCDCCITNLEGLSTSLQSLRLAGCSDLTHLSGIEHLSTLKSLIVDTCGVTSLQPLSQIGEGLQKLSVSYCHRVQEEVLELPHVQPTADVFVRHGNVKEVVLAGGVRKAVPPR
jgi:Leucine-rich repeat (LRR) protein